MNLKLVLKLAASLALIMCVTFVLQVLALKQIHLEPLDKLLVEAYVFNYVLAVGMFAALVFLRKKFSSALGFIFMAGSLLKFALFFILFQPSYKTDDIVDKQEFAAFFIPYAIALIIEVSTLIKYLNQLDIKSKTTIDS
ncbi:MAG: hypothetical protein MRY83_06990 [Flavobacteriales bacterium]|nr:hypothetical protein [Flavobacteriales bacterium]